SQSRPSSSMRMMPPSWPCARRSRLVADWVVSGGSCMDANIPPGVLRYPQDLYPEGYLREDRRMCSPATCKRCGKTTWSGCGQHVDQVMKRVPVAQRCSCTPSTETEPKGFFSSLFRR